MGALKKGGLDDLITSTTTLVPDSPAAAYDAYRQAASAVFLAGAQGLKYRKEHYELVVDLSKAGLSYIEDEGDEIVIGAMTPLWQLKISSVIQKLAGGASVEPSVILPIRMFSVTVPWRRHFRERGFFRAAADFPVAARRRPASG